MDVLGLYTFLFPGSALCQRGNGCLHRRNWIRADGAEPNILVVRFLCAVFCRGGNEHRRTAHWKMAAECGRSGHVRPAGDADRCRGLGVASPGLGDTIYMEQYSAALGL